MSKLRTERERLVCAVLCIVFSSLLLTLVVLETILASSDTGRYTALMAFQDRASMSYVGSLFLAHLITGGVGLYGVLGLIATYGHRESILAEGTRLVAVVFFTLSYWFWGALLIVQHKITLLAEHPTNPPDWVIQSFDASDALFALSGWGRLGPAMLLFGGLALMIWRSARLVSRSAAVLFGLMAASYLFQLLYLSLRGVAYGEGDAAYIADVLAQAGEIIAFILAGAALFTEKGVFARQLRT